MMKFFTTQAEIDLALAAYKKHKNLRDAAAVVGCSFTTLNSLLKSQNIDRFNTNRRTLEHVSTDQLKAILGKHITLKSAAIELDVRPQTLRHEIQHRGFADHLSLLKKKRDPDCRPMVSLIMEVLKTHGPLMDYVIAQKMSEKLGKEVPARNVADRITYERAQSGTNSFYIKGYARKEGCSTGKEGCIWDVGPGKDTPRPPALTPKERKLRLREQNLRSITKLRMIKKILARGTPATPFDGLLYPAKRRSHAPRMAR